MKQKNIFIASAVLLLVVFGVAAVLYKNHQADQAAQLIAQNRAVLERAHAQTFGNPNAPVHIVEFFDPACETCRDFYPLVKKMMAANPGKIKLSMRYAPLHKGSDQVVKAIEASRKQAMFQQTLETLFASQSHWVVQHVSQPQLIWDPLSGLPLDLRQLQADMESPAVAQVIAQDVADAKVLNITMTPEFFVNGKPLPSFGYEPLKKLVDEALLESTRAK
jgi:protein-disulfide isomerase